MIPPLRLELERVAEREHAHRWHGHLLALWAAGAAAAAGLLALRHWLGEPGIWSAFALALALGAGWFWCRARVKKLRPDLPAIARRIEHAHPGLDSLLLTAVGQRPGDGDRFSYLQRRVFDAALDDARFGKWDDVVPAASVRRRAILQRAAALLALGGIALLFALDLSGRLAARRVAEMLDVQPGDSEIERGRAVTFTARFAPDLPALAAIHFIGSPTSADLPLTRLLEDPVFTGTLPAVGRDLKYLVDFGRGRSREFTLKVFDPPTVEQVDAALRFPAYTGQAEAKIHDPRTITAMEQTELTLDVRTNGPMQAVELRARDGRVIPLARDPRQPTRYESTTRLDKSGDFAIALRDEAGHEAPAAGALRIRVSPNRPPTVKARLPSSRDRAGALQEVSFEAQVEDDFGLRAAGLVVQVGVGRPIEIPAPPLDPGARRTTLTHLVRLEDLGARPNDLIVWHAWGEDLGPDGKPRRTDGDIHLLPVRAFDEIARQHQSGGGPPEGNPGMQLIRLQTRILDGTWGVRRESAPAEPPAAEIRTLRDSQAAAIDQAAALIDRLPDPDLRRHASEAREQMTRALDRLKRGRRADLPPALEAEQAALAALYRLLSSDLDIALAKEGPGAPDDGDPALDDLDLKNMPSRYETETEAREEPDRRGREIQETLNRLKDLAQRQRDLNEELNRLQNARRLARTDADRAEAERQLKRLRDQQRELQEDMDRGRERMADSGGKSAPTPGQKALEQAAQSAERGARRLEAKQLAEALAEGARTQQALDKAEQTYRQGTAGELTQQLRDLRARARAALDRQRDLGRDIAQGSGPLTRRTLRDDPDSFAARAARQAKDFQRLADAVTGTARLAEEGEPLVARHLDEAIRQNPPAETTQALENMRSAASVDDRADALAAQQTAEKNIQALSQGIDAAAASILGSDADALRFAQNELDRLRQALTASLDPPTTSFDPPKTSFDPPTTSLDPPTTSLDPPKTSFDPPTTSLDPPKTSFDPPTTSLDPPTTPGNSPGAPGSPQTTRRDSPTAPTPSGGGPGGGGRPGESPFTDSANFQQWTDQVRDLEAVVDVPEARAALENARRAARDLRAESRRHARPPGPALVVQQVIQPLIEAQARIQQALNQLDHKDPLAPVERDPVPEKYSDAVRRYYEALGQ